MLVIADELFFILLESFFNNVSCVTWSFKEGDACNSLFFRFRDRRANELSTLLPLLTFKRQKFKVLFQINFNEIKTDYFFKAGIQADIYFKAGIQADIIFKVGIQVDFF